MVEERRKEELAKIRERFCTPDGQNVADYNPHDYRDMTRGTNYGETLIHVLKASLGTGILAMPEAFKHAGIVNGFFFTVLIGVVCTYGLHLLIRSQYALCQKLRVPYLPYPMAMKAACMYGPPCFTKFGDLGRMLVDIFLIVYQTGTCSVYIIFISANLAKLTNPFLETPLSIEAYIMILFPCLILIEAIPDMKWLAPFSLLSNILTFVTFGILLYYIFDDLPNLDNIIYFGPIKDFPLFVGTCLFAVAAVGCITSVERSMLNPDQFTTACGVLNTSMSVIIILYAILGLLGYWRWKGDVCASITLNLPKKDPAAKSIQAMYVVAIYISYALNGYVPVDIIWNTYVTKEFKQKKYSMLYEFSMRLVMVVVTVILALTIPFLGLIISLFGSACIPALELIFPAIMDVCVKYPDKFGKAKWVIIIDTIIIISGLVGIFSGSYTTIIQIVKEFQEKHGQIPKNDTCVDD